MNCPAELQELLKVLYSLNPSEAEVFYYLCDNEKRVSKVAENLDKDRSTVQRYLSKLRSAGLVKRRSKVEEGKKGRYFIYTTEDKERLKEKIKKRLEDWSRDKKEKIDSI